MSMAFFNYTHVAHFKDVDIYSFSLVCWCIVGALIFLWINFVAHKLHTNDIKRTKTKPKSNI